MNISAFLYRITPYAVHRVEWFLKGKVMRIMGSERSVAGLYLIALFFSFMLFGTAYANQEKDPIRQPPMVEVIGNGPLVPQSHHQSIPINFMNLDKVDVEILHITDPDTFLNDSYLLDNLSPYGLERLQHAYESVYADRFTLPPSKLNQQTAARIPLSHHLPSGWYVVVLKAPGAFDELKVKHVLLTDIGIQARLNTHQASFSVSRLSTGDAVTSGSVDIYRDHKLFRTAPIDHKGEANFDIVAKNTDIVIARTNKTTAERQLAPSLQHKSQQEIGILPLREAPLDLSDSKVGGRAYQPYEAFIYSNRDLVKPGESLPLNILLRDQDGLAIKDQPITLTVLDPRNDVVLSEQLSPQAASFYSKQLNTTSSWRTGRYTVEVRLDPEAQKPISQYFFELEEFVPERMDLTFSDPAKLVMAGSQTKVELNGRYLFGSPAAGNKVTAEVMYNPTSSFSGKYSDYRVGKRFSLASRYQQLDKQTLSAEGKAEIVLPTPSAAKIQSPVNAVVNFSLLETGGAAVQRDLRYTVWKDSPIAGVKPLQKSVGYDANPQFDIALLSHDGQHRLAGDLTVKVDYDQGPYYWLYEQGVGWQRKKQARWKSISSQTIHVEAGKSHRLSFATKWGQYRITVTDQASKTVTEYQFYAGWYDGYQQIKAKPEHLDIAFDQSRYHVGENIRSAITAPIAGSLLVTLETDKVIWSQRTKITKGKQDIEIPLPQGLNRHDIYLTATLTGNVDNAPKRYFGIKPVKLNREARKLSIKATMPPIIRPLTTLDIPITVAGIEKQQNDNTWVTVSLVDKGIINLSRFKPQDPFNYFFAQRRYSADVVDLYSRLYDLRPNPFAQSRFGSDSVTRTDNKNDDLVESKTVILMSKSIKVNNGKANVKLAIPDYNGEGQLIITTFNDSQVGRSVSSNKIAAPVVAELSIPRFLVAGDKSSVTVDIHNISGTAQTLSLALSANKGVNLAISLLPAKVTLQDGEHISYNVPFTVDSPIVVNRAEFKLQAHSLSQNSNNQIHIDRSWTTPIKSVMPWVYKMHSDLLEPQQKLTVTSSLWQGLDTIPDQLGFAYISQTPMLSVIEQARDLYQYPYGCAEQITSKALPYLYDLPELTRFKKAAFEQRLKAQGKAPNAEAMPSDRDMIYQAIMNLKPMQTSQGGFSLWPSDGYSSRVNDQPWLTVYVTDFLLRADKKFPNIVPKAMLKRAQDEILEYVKNPTRMKQWAYNQQNADSALTYAAYVLSQQGLLQWSDIDNLGLKLFPSGLSELQLAASYANVGDSDKALALLNNYHTVKRYSSYFQDYGSNLRDSALSVLILQQLKSNSILAHKAAEIQKQLLEQLVAESGDKLWLSTQERGALLQAAILTQTLNKDQPFDVTINGHDQQHTGPFSVPLTEGLTITNHNTKPLYVKLQGEGYQQRNKAVSNSDNPLNTLKVNTLSRSVYQLDGKPFTGNTVKVGQRLLVVLNVNLNQRVNEGLLSKMIPAGFVLENPALNQGLDVAALAPKGVTLSSPEHSEYRNDRYVISQSFDKDKTYSFAYLLRAEVPGTFTIPPIYMESMYQPSQHAVYWPKQDMVTIEK